MPYDSSMSSWLPNGAANQFMIRSSSWTRSGLAFFSALAAM
jgi:hypothetical protein